MAVYFTCEEPQALLTAFQDRVAQTEPRGSIATWVRSADGRFYTHRADAWTRKAWFRPSIGQTTLTFNIVKPANQAISTVAYAYYHGHLIETFLAHFDGMFVDARATAMPAVNDLVG
jgi:hypothetical protein